MSRALAYTRHLQAQGLEATRIAIVAACAVALIAAGQALPF